MASGKGVWNMRLTSAEIQAGIMELMRSDGKNHNTQEIKRYIEERKGVDFTHGQLAGSISYLQSLQLVKNVGRGIYRVTAKGLESSFSGERADGEERRDAAALASTASRREKALESLQESKRLLTEYLVSVNMLELETEEEFNWLKELKKLCSQISKLCEFPGR